MSTHFSRNPKVEMAPMKGETVLFNPANNKFCVLNVTAAFIWDTLERPCTLDEIASAMASHFGGVDLERAQREAGLALAQLRGIECVEHQP